MVNTTDSDLSPSLLQAAAGTLTDNSRPTCTNEQATVPLRSWLSKVSHTATSGTLVTPSVIIMIPVKKAVS